jgi:hypothetical protein
MISVHYIDFSFSPKYLFLDGKPGNVQCSKMLITLFACISFYEFFCIDVSIGKFFFPFHLCNEKLSLSCFTKFQLPIAIQVRTDLLKRLYSMKLGIQYSYIHKMSTYLHHFLMNVLQQCVYINCPLLYVKGIQKVREICM